MSAQDPEDVDFGVSFVRQSLRFVLALPLCADVDDLSRKDLSAILLDAAPDRRRDSSTKDFFALVGTVEPGTTFHDGRCGLGVV